ncbi:MAG: photosystem II biogenesis protein Psp29 [Cyanobacteria bacterium P01_E01_bin.42]
MTESSLGICTCNPKFYEKIGKAVSSRVDFVDNVRTLSDTKQNFYNHHARPINSIYRRVVEEVMVEMHLLSVNVNFQYDPIYGLGVVTAFDRFMAGYQPERDKVSIFNGLCLAIGEEPQKYRDDAMALSALAQRLSVEQLVSWNSALVSLEEGERLYETLKSIAFAANFKYSRLFAIGLYALLEAADRAVVMEEERREKVLAEIGNSLHLPVEKMQKDLEIYQGNLEKMEQAKQVLDDVLKTDRQKRQERLLAKQEAQPDNSEQSSEETEN